MKNLLVQGGDAFDLEEVLAEYKAKGPPIRLNGSTATASEIEEALYSSSLFSQAFVVISEAEKLKGKAEELVAAFLKSPLSRCTLVMHATGKNEWQKRLPVREIATVAPWDKQAKLSEWLQEYCRKQNVLLKREVAMLIAGQAGVERLQLKQELDKLMAYIGENKEIKAPDVAACIALEAEPTLWQLSEAYLHKDTQKTLTLLQGLLDAQVSPFLIVRHLRHVVHQALMMCSLASQGIANVADHFPQAKGKLFEKNFKLAQTAGRPFLSKALVKIDQAELALKDGPFDENTLLLKVLV